MWFLIFSLLGYSYFAPSVAAYDCGPLADGMICSGGMFEDQCCSKGGYCGTTPAFCSLANCQPKFGACGMDNHCGPLYEKNCTEEYEYQCCSKDGECGVTAEHCAVAVCDLSYGARCGADDECGPTVGKKCTGANAGQCCSKDGKCGTDPDFCNPATCDSDWTDEGVCFACQKDGECKASPENGEDEQCANCKCCNEGKCTKTYWRKTLMCDASTS